MTDDFGAKRIELERQVSELFDRFEVEQGVVVTGFTALRQHPYSTSSERMPLKIRLTISIL